MAKISCTHGARACTGDRLGCAAGCWPQLERKWAKWVLQQGVRVWGSARSTHLGRMCLHQPRVDGFCVAP